MPAQCRQWVGKPRAQIEGLVAERYVGLTEEATRETGDSTPTPAKPPDESNPTPVQVKAPEPLDGLDPDPRTRWSTHSDEPSVMLRELARKTFRMAKAVEANIWAVHRTRAEPDGDAPTFRMPRQL